MLKSPISLRLGTNVRYQELAYVTECQVKILHEEPHKVPLLITLSDGCYAQFPVIILPPISCRLAGGRLAVIDRDFHRGDETILNFATVW